MVMHISALAIRMQGLNQAFKDIAEQAQKAQEHGLAGSKRGSIYCIIFDLKIIGC